MTDLGRLSDAPDFKASYPAAPVRIINAILCHVRWRRPCGGFTTALLSNDLSAVLRADKDSLAGIKDLVMFVHNEVPAQCWGSPEKVSAWLAAYPSQTE